MGHMARFFFVVSRTAVEQLREIITITRGGSQQPKPCFTLTLVKVSSLGSLSSISVREGIFSQIFAQVFIHVSMIFPLDSELDW